MSEWVIEWVIEWVSDWVGEWNEALAWSYLHITPHHSNLLNIYILLVDNTTLENRGRCSKLVGKYLISNGLISFFIVHYIISRLFFCSECSQLYAFKIIKYDQPNGPRSKYQRRIKVEKHRSRWWLEKNVISF